MHSSNLASNTSRILLPLPPVHWDWNYRPAPPTKALSSFFIDEAPHIQSVKDMPKAMLEGSYTNHPCRCWKPTPGNLKWGAGRLTDHKIHPFKVYSLVIWGTIQRVA